MRKKIRQPFKFGSYLIEYREKEDSLVKIYKEKLDTLHQAERARDELVLKGYTTITIREVG